MIRYKNLTIVPTYHQNLDFVHEVRKIFYADIPDAIAVEFPVNLASYILQGVERLPKPSIVIYYDELLKSQLFVPVVPSDSLIEAIRLGEEYGMPVEFIDLFVKNYSPEIPVLPDSYILDSVSLDEFYSLFNKHMELDQRAQQRYQARAQKSHHELNQSNNDADQLESEKSTQLPAGKDAQAWLKDPEEIDDLRERFMAARLLELMKEYKNILVVIGLAHWSRIRCLLEHGDISEDLTALAPDVQAELFNLMPDDLPLVYSTPNLAFQFEIFRQRQKTAIDSFSEFDKSSYNLIKFDQFLAIKIIIQRSLEHYKNTYHEEINLHKLKAMFQYMRNLPLVQSHFRPELFEVVLAAKSMVNDDFAWIVWEECKLYPSAKDDPRLESARLTEHGIFIRGRYFNLRRHIPLQLLKVKLPLKPKPKEKHTGEWREQWNKNQDHIVSHIPEDVFEENYFQHVRMRSMNLLKDQFIRIHEFTSTLLDGIDFRETIRNWPLNQKIFVREERPIHGEVDSVVIIFDTDDRVPERYPHIMMWYAEHKHESDLAVYSSYPGIDLVGPGISRVELGGVTSFFPPRGVPDIWGPKFLKKFPFAKRKSDRLLTAAIVYAQKKFITYIAKEPPAAKYQDIARKLGIKIIYLQLDRFNPVSLRALRNLHMLAGKRVRQFADKYISKRRY